MSVYRAKIVSPREVLDHAQAIPGSRLASATVRAIRALTNKAGSPLGLDVVAVDDETNLGHAEIRGPESGKLTEAASKALRDLFKLVPTDATSS